MSLKPKRERLKLQPPKLSGVETNRLYRWLGKDVRETGFKKQDDYIRYLMQKHQPNPTEVTIAPKLKTGRAPRGKVYFCPIRMTYLDRAGRTKVKLSAGANNLWTIANPEIEILKIEVPKGFRTAWIKALQRVGRKTK